MRTPRKLMDHRFDLYKATITKDGGAAKQSYSSSPTKESVPSNIQPALSEVKDDYGRRDEIVSDSIYLLDKEVFDLVKVQDRIVANSVKYMVKGKQNLAGRDRVFRIDVVEESV